MTSRGPNLRDTPCAYLLGIAVAIAAIQAIATSVLIDQRDRRPEMGVVAIDCT